MSLPDGTTITPEPAEPHGGGDLPPGDHPLEVAARRGIGPLSPAGAEMWHGQAKPCVSCGQLVPRNAEICSDCGQDLSEEMIERMRAHAGPWSVFEHVRPFPGVTLERIVRQIRRGLITETSILRGPTTDYQWRFAVETPGVSRYFGKCWNCHEEVTATDTYCRHCLAYLSFERNKVPAGVPAAEPAAPATGGATGAGVSTDSQELQRLSAALGQAGGLPIEPELESPARVAGLRTVWITAALLFLAVAALFVLVALRGGSTGIRRSTASNVEGVVTRAAN